MVNPEDEAKIREIIDQAINQGPKRHRILRVTGLLKTPGRVQYEMRHLSFTVEEEIPADRKRSDVVREICQDLGPLVLEFEPRPPATNSNIPKSAAAASDPTPEVTPEFLDTLGWKSFPAGGGEWIFFNTPGAEALGDEIAKTSEPVAIGNFRYKITVGKTRDRDGNLVRFINRFPVT